MTNAVVGALGAALGLAAHDLAIGALTDDRPLRPLKGVCPECGHERGWRRVRCPECGRVIQREPVVAVVSALVAVGFANTVGATWLLIPYLGFLGLSTALLVTDLEVYRIVNRLNIRGTLLAAALLAASALAVSDPSGLLRGLAGAAAYFAGAAILWLVVRGRGFGAGDVKLAAQLGLFTAFVSWGALAWAVFATAMIGGVVAVGLVMTGAARMKTELPYGPPMILGAWLAIILTGLGSV